MTTISYDPKTSLLLAQVCALTYVQYQKSMQDPNYDGAITPPPGYKQTAVFKAPEISFDHHPNTECGSDHIHFSKLDPAKVVLSDLKSLEEKVKCVKKVFFGFALEAINGSGNGIIALRGTQKPYEWVMDATFVQTPVPLVWFDDHKLELAKVHFGFLFLYAFLKEQITNAAKNFSNLQTCYVTGHSLGAALAVLAALHLGHKTFPQSGKVQMYNYAGPRVGDPVFCDAYNAYIPHSYRVVNLADMVPIVPPPHISQFQYRHVGSPDHEWSYCNQTGDIADNHSLENNYIPALQNLQKISNQRDGGLDLPEAVATRDI